MSWQWVTTDVALRETIEQARGYEAVAVDTEFRRRDTFFPQVALVQVATPDHCWLIDPLTLSDTGPLKTLLLDPSVVKVLHSASEDLEVFEHWLGVLPSPLFDTQRAAALLNRGFGLSYRALVQQLLGTELAKDETQSDWLARPLSAAQCEYAALDVTLLIACWPTLAGECHARGRFAWVLEEGSHMSTGGRGPLAKFKNAWKLQPKQQAVLRALVEWREAEARSRDKPRSWILSDRTLSDVAQKCPSSLPQLAAIDGLHQGLLRRQGKALLSLIADATASSAPVEALAKPASAAVKRLAKTLAGELTTIAEDLGANPEILLPSRELELLAQQAMGQPTPEPSHWQGWRKDTVIAPLQRRALQQLKQGAAT